MVRAKAGMLLVLATLGFAGCGEPVPQPRGRTQPLPHSSPVAINPALISLANASPDTLGPDERGNLIGAAVFRNTCALCHGPGIADAPRLEDPAAWAPRLARGVETLYGHAVNGFRGEKGLMPAKGGNPSLGDDEVRAAVDYMISRATSRANRSYEAIR